MAVRFKASLTEHNNAFTLGVCSSGVAKSANISKTVRPSGPWDRTGPRSLSLSRPWGPSPSPSPGGIATDVQWGSYFDGQCD